MTLRGILAGMGVQARSVSGREILERIDWAHWKGEKATLVFLVRGERALLIRKKRGLGAGKVNGPGGKFAPGETPLACARREVEEELGILPLGLEARGELRFQFTDGYAIHVFVFVGDAFEGTPVETDEARPLWCEVSDLPFDEMWEDDRLWLPPVLAGQTVQGRFLFQDATMLAHEIDLSAPGVQRIT